MYYGNIKGFSIENGVGVRVSLFVSGCRNHCKNCFSPQTWNFTYGEPFTEETEKELLEELAPDHIHGLTILGGEPFEPENQKDILPLILKVRRELPGKTIWMNLPDRFLKILMCWWTDALWKKRRIFASGSAALKISGSLI